MAWPFKKISDGVADWQLDRRNQAEQKAVAARLAAERKAREKRERDERLARQSRNLLLGCSAIFAAVFAAIFGAIHFLATTSVDRGSSTVPQQFAAPSGAAPAIKFDSRSTEDVYVKGYYRKDGTYVAPHTRSRHGSK